MTAMTLPDDSVRRLAERASVWVLVAANLLVGALALYGHWGVMNLLVLYWFEALVIGGFNVLRLMVVGLFGEQPFGATLARWVDIRPGARIVFTLAGVGFFAFKFAGFALLVGFTFLWLFNVDPGVSAPAGSSGADVPMSPLIAIVAGSHAVSFVWNFLICREYRTQSVPSLIFWPYVRMAAVLGVAAIGTLFIVLVPAANGSIVVVAIFVLLKTLADALSHRWVKSPAAD
jgi:hypothetical protein